MVALPLWKVVRFYDFVTAMIPDFTHKTYKFSLGFTTGAQRAVRHARIGRTPMHISNRGFNAIEDSEEDSYIDNWIYPTAH